MDKAKLSALSALMEGQVTGSQARLATVLRREARLLAMLSELDHLWASSGQAYEKERIAMIDFQNEVQLRRWIDQCRASLNSELAQVRALLAIEREKLAVEFGRSTALDMLAQRAARAGQKRAQRRKDYGS